MTNTSQEIHRLRHQGLSIREIAKELGITKYTVEKALKAMESDSLISGLQTVCGVAELSSQTGENVTQPGGQTLPNVHQTPPNCLHNEAEIEKYTDPEAHEIDQNTSKNMPEKLKNAYSPTVYFYMVAYKSFLNEMHTNIKQKRGVWLHIIENNYLKKIENLRLQADAHCQKLGLCYGELLVSEVLETCAIYFREQVLNAPLQKSFLGLGWVKFPVCEEILVLLKEAQGKDFYVVRNKREVQIQ